MLIGIPKEIKNREYRVGATPAMVQQLVHDGHKVMVQKGAGEAIGYTNEMYTASGGEIVETAADAYKAEMIIKVKEPQKSEFPLMHEGQILYTYLHLAPDPEQTKELLNQKVVAFAYETITDDKNRLPLLVPMSEIAGRISIQAGATALQMVHGGRGVLLGGVPGVKPAKVVVIGGGVVGTQAARMALGLGSNVTILDTNLNRLRELDDHYGPHLKTLYSTRPNLEEALETADLVVGAVLIPGKKAPSLVTRDMLKLMQKGSVLVDVAIDQGGCFETSKPTTHDDPLYVVDDIVHYCVANMPGAAARTATQALTNATMHYARMIARLGWKEAIKLDKHLKNGLNVCHGEVTYKPVADDLGYTFKNPDDYLS